MLVQFSVENYLSFNEEVIFSMAAAGDQQHLAHIVEDEVGQGVPLLRTAAIYGANGAGKSNLVEAIGFAQDLILQGTRSGQTIPITPFKLSRGSRSSKFEFILKHQGILYSYGFRLDSARILEEWLFATPNKKEVRFF